MQAVGVVSSYNVQANESLHKSIRQIDDDIVRGKIAQVLKKYKVLQWDY